MKHEAILITALAVVAFAAGCHHDQRTVQDLEKAQTDAKAAAEDMKDYTYAQKAELVQQMEIRLANLNQDLDKLSARIDRSSDSVKAEAKPKLQALRVQANELGRQLDNVKNANQSTWDNVKAGATKAYVSVADGVHQAREWLSEKIAP